MSAAATTTSTEERRLIAAAREGDEDAYRRLVEPRHAELHAHCYRMLGSVHDAEDSLQEALLRAWRGLPRFEDRSSLRAWLYKISTNTCLDELARRPKRVLPIDYGPSADPHDSPGAPLVESVWIEPYPDAGLAEGRAAPEARYELRESVELAFVAALQHLPATQRAVLILREVLGFSAQEVADTLETTVASVNSALQRARKAVDERLPDQSQQATLRSLGDERIRELVQSYMEALERGDVDALVAMLSEEAAWSMPPLPRWYRGEEAIAAFLAEYPCRERWRHVPSHANGQVAVGCYLWDPERETYAAAVLDVLTLRGSRIAQVTAFLAPWLYGRFGELPGHMTPDAFRRFGLPDDVPEA
jgi:RNA polymerase sigma-70 factor (ECF subfamily)